MRLSNGEVLLCGPLAQHSITQGWYYNDGSLHQAIDLRTQLGMGYKPAAVQVFALDGATDIILRRDIGFEKITDEDGNKQTVCNCEERQFRVASTIPEKEVTADFDAWWDYQPPREAEPVTASDRLDALEAAVYDLAEVVYNG